MAEENVMGYFVCSKIMHDDIKRMAHQVKVDPSQIIREAIRYYRDSWETRFRDHYPLPFYAEGGE